MHSIIHVAISSTTSRSCYSYAFAERSDGNAPLAWKGIPMHISWNDQSITHWNLFEALPLLNRFVFLSLTKGIYDHKLERYLRYDEELVVPIIENTPFEKDLEERMNETMQEYPGSTAILVRRHGIYVWGETWQKAKTQSVQLVLVSFFKIYLMPFFIVFRCECYDYLFGIAVEMRRFGLEPNAPPTQAQDDPIKKPAK